MPVVQRERSYAETLQIQTNLTFIIEGQLPETW